MTRMKRSTLLVVAAVLVLLLAAGAFLFSRGKPTEHGAPKSKEAAAQPRTTGRVVSRASGSRGAFLSRVRSYASSRRSAVPRAAA